MCGIAVLTAPDGVEIPDKAIECMTLSLQHRGPDEQRWVRSTGCHLGHTRLSVIDLAGGQQPMQDLTRRYVIVFNGEIFNYRALRRELEGRGREFRTQSDTEVLLQAYLEFGLETPRRLNGQFSFAIWDRQEQQLFAARDRMGEKPFYWSVTSRGIFMAASELKALTACGLLKPKLSGAALSAYLALYYVPPDRSIYENVHLLKPGNSLTWKAGDLREWAYWCPRYSSNPVLDRPAAVERIRELLGQAVRRQMVSDVPIGAFLSGGLDSSTLVAFLAKETGNPVRTFSAGFGDLINELPYAQDVATAYRTEHHAIQMDIPVGELLERMAQVYDEPFADSSNIPTFLISEFARQHVKVVLSGDGGDELFGGYTWYEPLCTELHPDRKDARRKMSFPSRVREMLRKLKGFRINEPNRLWERHLTGVGSWSAIPDEPARVPGRRQTYDALRSAWGSGVPLTGLDVATDFDVRCFLPGDILVKVDRAAMAHGLETRAPFLDVDLVEFVLGLPWHWRFSGTELKGLLREACGDLWPLSLRGRGKQGFGAPVDHWIIRPDVQTLWRRVCSPQSALAVVLPEMPFDAGRLPAQHAWTLLCLGLWLETRTECLNDWPQ